MSEVGYQQVKPDGQDTRTLAKLTTRVLDDRRHAAPTPVERCGCRHLVAADAAPSLTTGAQQPGLRRAGRGLVVK